MLFFPSTRHDQTYFNKIFPLFPVLQTNNESKSHCETYIFLMKNKTTNKTVTAVTFTIYIFETYYINITFLKAMWKNNYMCTLFFDNIHFVKPNSPSLVLDRIIVFFSFLIGNHIILHNCTITLLLVKNYNLSWWLYNT